MKNINQSKKKHVEKVFDEVFNKYDLMNDLMSFGAHRVWKDRLMDWMNPKKDDHLVDMASGTGDVAKAFLNKTNFLGKVTCVEPNKFMLSAGKKKLKSSDKIKWYCCPAEKLPFKDETFDVIVSTECFEHDMFWTASLRKIFKMFQKGLKSFPMM